MDFSVIIVCIYHSCFHLYVQCCIYISIYLYVSHCGFLCVCHVCNVFSVN